MFNLFSLIIQKYILLAIDSLSLTTQERLTSAGAVEIVLATGAGSCTEDNVEEEIMTENGDNTKKPDELTTTIDSDAGDESTAAPPLVSPPSPAAPPASDDSNIIII